MTTTTVRSWVSRHTFTAVPADWRDEEEIAYMWEVTVEQSARGLWSVRSRGRWFDATGSWNRGPVLGQLHSEWWDGCHYDLETALQLAERAAPDVSVNGMKARDLR